MEKKLTIFIEILIVIGAFTFYFIKYLIPDFKNQYGSSDKLFNFQKYQNMYLIKVDDNPGFSLLIDKDEVVYHLFIFDNYSISLYNKNIENMSLDNAIDTIVPELIECNLLKNNSDIKVLYPGNLFLDSFKKSLDNNLLKYQINNSVDYMEMSLSDIALIYNITGDSEEEILNNLDYYSKESIRIYKSQTGEAVSFDIDLAKEMANNIYKKIELYIFNNQINNLDRSQTELDIAMIPGDSNLHYYPSSNSWFYVEDGKVYAYIEFIEADKSFSFCYKGSIDLRNEGECVA